MARQALLGEIDDLKSANTQQTKYKIEKKFKQIALGEAFNSFASKLMADWMDER